MVKRTQEAVPNVELYNLRDARGESQEQTAMALNDLAMSRGEQAAVTGNQVSRWERGVSRPSPLHRQLLAEHFEVSVSELGLARPRGTSPTPRQDSAPFSLAIGRHEAAKDGRVGQSQEDWLRTRQLLGKNHATLAKTAAHLYAEPERLGDTGLITREGWLFNKPIVLSDLRVAMADAVEEPAVTGTETGSRAARPLMDGEQRYSRYSHAIRDLARPRLFENRPGWRLVDADLGGLSAPTLSFADTTYFDTIDVCEALAHEAASTHLTPDGTITAPSWRGLNLRRLIGDPFDLSRRSVMPSTDTLTIRASPDGASFVLHDRGGGNVASSGGMLSVMPAGTFQPSTVRRGAHLADFDLWRNIMREYSEEFLGNPEHGGDGSSVDYQAEPFGTLDAELAAGKIRAYCFGLALDALTLWAEILTVVVFDADVYDRLFADMVNANSEGSVVQVGTARPTSEIPFTRSVIDELNATGRLAPEAAGCLELAWAHRRDVLST